MSTTQKISVKGLKIGEGQLDLLGETVKELVGDAGTVTVKEKDSEGLRIRSRHAVAANAQFADIKIRFHGASADVGIYVDADGQIGMAWDGYVVRGNTQLKDTFEGRADRVPRSAILRRHALRCGEADRRCSDAARAAIPRRQRAAGTSRAPIFLY